MAGEAEGGRIELRQVQRISNGPIARDGHLRWDLNRLYQMVLSGLRRIPEAESVAIDGWGVDYGLLDDDGISLLTPWRTGMIGPGRARTRARTGPA